MHLGIYPFDLHFTVYLNIRLQYTFNSSLDFVVFVVCPIFHLWFLLIWVFSFLCLVMLAQGLSIFLIFSKKQIFVSLIIFIVIFSQSRWSQSCFLLFLFVFLFWLVFSCLSNSSMCIIRLFIWDRPTGLSVVLLFSLHMFEYILWFLLLLRSSFILLLSEIIQAVGYFIVLEFGDICFVYLDMTYFGECSMSCRKDVFCMVLGWNTL
jgi:hypothetical protein